MRSTCILLQHAADLNRHLLTQVLYRIIRRAFLKNALQQAIALAQYDKRKLSHIAYCVHGSTHPNLCADAGCIEQLLKL